MKHKINLEFSSVTEQFLHLFHQIPDEEINILPFENSWTAGRVLKHVCLSDRAIIKWLYGNTSPSHRKPDEYLDKLSVLLNFNIKFISPPFIVPPDKQFSKHVLINEFISSRAQLREGMNNLDLSQICKDIELKDLQGISRLELIYFVIYHTKRHIFQLTNISKHLVNVG